MNAPAILQRHPELRWLVSAALIIATGTIVATTVSGVFRDDPALPATSPEQLVAEVHTPHTGGYSGTIVTRTDLKLPAPLRAALVHTVPVGGSLLSGTHQLRYWYGGPQRQRVAVLGPTAEQDVFRNGDQMLTWDTRTHVARRGDISAMAAEPLPLSLATPAALTPPALADEILDSAGSTSNTTLRSGDPVAHRSTYELVVRPNSSASRISRVVIDIDGREAVPLRVQVFTAHDAVNPAVDVAFQTINYTTPIARNFTFTPPPTAQVQSGTSLGALADALDEVSLIGSGWTTVASYDVSKTDVALIGAVLGADLKKVKGRWGSGRLLDTPLLCLLITTRGQLVAGAVTPSVLYTAVTR